MAKDFLSGSHIKYIQALSPGHWNAAGSTGPSNFGGFEWATLLVTVGCAVSANATARLTVDVERSGTSNGTFANFGASLPSLSAGSQMFARSFRVDSSAVWHRVTYNNNNNGSVNAGIIVALAAARVKPVDQDSQTTVYSDVI